MQEIMLEETAKWLMSCEDAYILIHRSPDGDCLGAGYALMQMLLQMGKRATVLCEDIPSERYAFLWADVPFVPEFAPQCVIAVDVADPELLGETLRDKYATKVDLCIDHHLRHVPYGARCYRDADAAASCEILYQIATLLPITLTDSIATCLYTGMATDTGCFQFDNARARTHTIVAELMTHNPDIAYAQINRRMFAVKSLARMRLEGQLTEKIELYFDKRCALIAISYDDIQNFGIEDSELDGLANFPLQVEGACVGVTMKEKERGKWRISMRSADTVNVAEICALLGGGGHAKAAGCSVIGDSVSAHAAVLTAVEKGTHA